MIMLLNTKVIPIEYNEQTKRKAQQIKRVIEKNPEFFKVFLKGDKISLIDEKNPLYIKKGQSILSCLDTISAFDATGFLKDRYTTTPEEILYYWASRYYGIGEYQNKENRLRKMTGIYDYFHTMEDYQGLYNYLNSDEKEQVEEDVFTWLESTYRYHLLNYLLVQQLPLLSRDVFSKFEIDEKEGIAWFQNLSRKVLEELNPVDEELKITYPISRKETITLFREFLMQIDPTLELLYQGISMEFNHDLVTSKDNSRVKNIKSIQESPNKAMVTFTKSREKIVYVPWTNTLQDIYSLVHEFFHYIEESNSNIYQSDNPICEIAPIFFELLLLDFLKEKGYPEEEVEKLRQNREIDTLNDSQNLLSYMQFLETINSSRPVTPRKEEEVIREYDAMEDLSEDIKDQIIEATCDEQCESLIDDPFYIIDIMKYTLAYYYANIALEKEQSGVSMIPSMITLAKDVEKLPPREILKKTGLIEIGKVYRKETT